MRAGGGAGAHELGASYLGVPVCGPRPGADAAPVVPWARAGVAVQEWDASELAFRFLAQLYGVTPYAATAENIVRGYSAAAGGGLTAVANGTAGAAPKPGDVVSFDSPTTTGNAAVVAWSVGRRQRQRQPCSCSRRTTPPTAGARCAVMGWTLQGFGGTTPYAWLHDPAGRGYAVPPHPPASGRATAEPPDAEPRPLVPDPPSSTRRPPLPG